MLEALDLDLDGSLVALDDEGQIGLANLGLRDERSWLGGIGVVPARRRGGVGQLLARSLLDRARDAGAHEMALEVIVENAAAVALYEKLGFERTRELDVLSLTAGRGDGAAEEVEFDDALGLVASYRKGRAVAAGGRDRREPRPARPGSERTRDRWCVGGVQHRQ
jgi:hypothetical protein